MGEAQRLKNYSTYQLLDMVNRRYRLSKEIIIELLKELDKREVSNERVEELKAEFPEYKKAFAKEPQKAAGEEQTPGEALPKLYSIRAIFLFSIIFSTFFASILMAFNLNEVKQKKAILPLVSFGFIYTATIASMSQHLASAALLLAIALNVAGAFLIVHFFWNNYIGSQEFEKRSTTTPLLIGIGISLPMIYLLSQNGMVM